MGILRNSKKMLNINNNKVRINHYDYFGLWIIFVTKSLHIYDIFIFIVDGRLTKVEEGVTHHKQQGKNQSLLLFTFVNYICNKMISYVWHFYFLVHGYFSKVEEDVKHQKRQGKNQSLWLFSFVSYICNKMITYLWHFYFYSWWAFYESRKRC